MQTTETGFAVMTTAALKIAGLPYRQWRTAVDKRDFISAPPTVGTDRRWSDDDLLVLCWYASLWKSGMARPLAGQLANALHRAIAREPNAETMNCWAWEADGERGCLRVGTTPPDEAPKAEIIFVIPVSQWRENVRLAVANLHAKKGARDGKRR